MRIPGLYLFILLVGVSCSNIEDAEFSERATFARFIEVNTALEGVSAVPLTDGYLVLGQTFNDTLQSSTLYRLDLTGTTVWSTTIPGMLGKSLAVGPSGYFVFGDSINVDPQAEKLVDLVTESAILQRVDASGTLSNRMSLADTSSTDKIDFTSSSLTFDVNGNLLVLGTYRLPFVIAPARPFLLSLDPASYDTLWGKSYDIIDRDYVNAKSLYVQDDGHIVWATAILREQQDFTRSYLAVPYIKEQSVFENNDTYGETTDQQLLIGDMAPAASPEFGYGVVGSYASPTGDDGNVFFARVTKSGKIIDGSERFFDAASADPLVAVGTSVSEDTGDAICSTQDGGFILAGTMLTTPSKGNGGKDILLIKVDGFGNIVWMKTMGGSGDDVVNSIVETADGGLLVCGSKDAGGLPAIMLLKLNKNGEIKD